MYFMYLDHSLVGERKNLFGPLLLKFHRSISFRDVLPSCQQLAVQNHCCFVHDDAFSFHETVGKKKSHQLGSLIYKGDRLWGVKDEAFQNTCVWKDIF